MLLGGVLTASAVPANPVPRVFTQPDGTKLTLTQKGDEFCSYYLSEDKLVLRQDEKGWFRVVGADGKLTALTPAQFRLTPEASSYSAREVHQTLEKSLKAMNSTALPPPASTPARQDPTA